MREGLFTLVVVVFICALIYGLTFIGKWLSYEFMYESFVKETVVEMVKKEALNEEGE